MTPLWRIRSTEDYDAIVELDRVIFAGDDPVVLDGREWWLVLDGEGEPQGFAGAETCDGGRSLYLARCGLRQPARGQGLQRRLIHVRERWGRAQGADVGLTYTWRHNVRSANNLAACGYLLYRPEWAYGGPEALYWQRRLGVAHPGSPGGTITK